MAEILQDALSGAGFADRQLFTVLASEQGFARFKKGWLFDVNLDHAAAVDGFDRSTWNALELKARGSTLQNYDYSITGKN